MWRRACGGRKGSGTLWPAPWRRASVVRLSTAEAGRCRMVHWQGMGATGKYTPVSCAHGCRGCQREQLGGHGVRHEARRGVQACVDGGEWRVVAGTSRDRTRRRAFSVGESRSRSGCRGGKQRAWSRWRGTILARRILDSVCWNWHGPLDIATRSPVGRTSGAHCGVGVASAVRRAGGRVVAIGPDRRTREQPPGALDEFDRVGVVLQPVDEPRAGLRELASAPVHHGRDAGQGAFDDRLSGCVVILRPASSPAWSQRSSPARSSVPPTKVASVW